jgi:hypothetical protein
MGEDGETALSIASMKIWLLPLSSAGRQQLSMSARWPLAR